MGIEYLPGTTHSEVLEMFRVAAAHGAFVFAHIRDWDSILRKMTLMPAERLQARVPGMRRKGRVQAGTDADLTVFDPKTVIDRATYAEPTLPSVGIQYVLVKGEPVVHDGEVVEDVFPGEPIRGPLDE